jgi:DNA repair protein RecO (recombination protein O)
MNIQQTEAVVLQTEDYGESDRLITFYTKLGGKLKGIAKGARRSSKRFVNAFEPCSLVDLTYKSTRSLAWIEACKLIEPYLALRMDLQRWAGAALASEIMLEMVAEGDPDPGLFFLLRDTLARLAEGKDPKNILSLFLLRFLHATGHLPALESCSVCQCPLRTAKQWSWNVQKGALYCHRHRLGSDGISLDVGTLLLIRQSRSLPLEKIWRLHLLNDKKSLLCSSILRWISGQIKKDLKSLKLFV